jgi:hypothetical protein
MELNNEISIVKKRGRKRKNIINEIITQESNKNNIVMIIEEIEEIENQNRNESEIKNKNDISINKKRGRKPKGGKIITKKVELVENTQPITNVILHLKCSMQDLNEHNNKMNQIVTDPLLYNPNIPPSIMSYDLNETSSFSVYENIKNNNNNNNNNENMNYNSNVPAYNDFLMSSNSFDSICKLCSEKLNMDELNDVLDEEEVNIKDINSKLKTLKLMFYKNENMDKRSACFWCTYDYDNQPCYIPKYEIDGNLYGYGSFCRPECAVAYLMKENIDDSMKFERYHLLNQIYSKIYNFKKNIKPAPNPFFLLDKFYGNLTIQEYRKLLKTEHMLLVVEKPMTLVLPELHDDNDDFIMNIYGGTSQKNENVNHNGIYKVKRQSEKKKGPSKTSIMKENFGF